MLVDNKTIASLNFGGKISPENFLVFSEDYQKHLPKLLEFLREKTGHQVSLICVRMNTDGGSMNLQKETMSGIVKEVGQNSFVFETSKELGGLLHEELFLTTIRTDNVLGVVPLLLSEKDMNPFAENNSPETKEYFKFLIRVRTLLKTCLQVQNYVELDFHNPTNNTKEIISGEILEVNKSNVKIRQMKKVKENNNKKPMYLDRRDQKTFRLFLSNELFLQKITIHYGEKFKIDPYDDGEVF